MPSSQGTVDFIVEQVARAGSVTERKMFGEYAIYCDGRLVALVCDDQLFIEPTTGGRAFIGSPIEKPPYPGAKACFWIAGELWDDGDWMTELVRISAAELPSPAKRARKPPKRSR
jgi:TfoX/Sxy family transcriptional regulator of competence genes